MKKFLEKDMQGNWNTVPPVPAENVKNVNCHKFVLHSIGKISWEEMISDPVSQRAMGADFTFGERARLISDLPYKLVKDQESLAALARKSCEAGKTYVGQVLDTQTKEMAHSFIVTRESENKYVCFDKPGFKYPFAVSDLNSILDFKNKDGEQSNKNQEWRFVSIEREALLDSIMTAEEYSRTRHETPYLFETKSGKKELYYFGAPHTSDPKSPLFIQIEMVFNKVRPDIVFVEGIQVRGDRTKFNERVNAASREDAINLAGESGFTLKLAFEKGIDWRCPEPTDEDLYKDLLSKGFSKDEMFAWNLFHMLPQYNRQMNKRGFKHHVEPFIGRFKEATAWKDFDYSYERAITLGERILGKPIDVENEPDALDFVDPIPWQEKKANQTVLNRISEASGVFRDRSIVAGIIDAFKDHDRVFVVYGASHAVMQEPALRKFFCNLK